jgi:hypothetical protein
MNLVKLIQEQLSGNTLSELSDALGEEPEATSAAASAAVPTLLGGLAKLFSGPDGASRLSNVLSSPDIGALGNISQFLGGDSGSLIGKGTGLLGSLFGDGITNAAASAISRFSGMSQGDAKNLLAMLMPLVLGKVASQWKSRGGTPSALTNLFAEQKRNIADAMPAGYSLDDIPGLSDASAAAQTAAHTTRRTAETAGRAAPSIASWAIPLAIAVVGGFLLWNALKPKPAPNPEVAEATPAGGEEVVAMKPAIPENVTIPPAAELAGNLNGTFESLGDVFGSIRDEASAEAAAPKLASLNTEIDRLSAILNRLPDTARQQMQPAIDSQLEPIKEQAQQALATPGLSERIKTIINQILRKLENWSTVENAG